MKKITQTLRLHANLYCRMYQNYFAQKSYIYPHDIQQKTTEAFFVGSAVARREEVMSQQRVEGRHKDHYKAKT